MFINRIDTQIPKPGKKGRVPGKKEDTNAETENSVFEIDVVQISGADSISDRAPKEKRKPKNNPQSNGNADNSSLDITA